MLEFIRKIFPKGLLTEEAIRYFTGLVIASLWAGSLTIMSSLFGNVPQLTSIGWLIVFLSTTFAGIIIWISVEFMLLIREKRQRLKTTLASTEPAMHNNNNNNTEEKRSVEFLLPSSWGEGFRRGTISQENGHELAAEEIVLLVRATEKMQDVRFEISAKAFRGTTPREEIARISSDLFNGVVQKGIEQRFVIMRRIFWVIPASFKHPNSERTSTQQVRVEKEVLFFPENPLFFHGSLGNTYHFSIRVLHDEGPDTAHFVVDLRHTRTCAQSIIISRSNINPYMGN